MYLIKYNTEYLILPVNANFSDWKKLNQEKFITILYEDNDAFLASINKIKTLNQYQDYLKRKLESFKFNPFNNVTNNFILN